MNPRRTFMLEILLICSAVWLTGCPGNIMLNLDYKPPKAAESPLSSAHSLRVKPLNFGDKRAGQIDAKLIGYRQAAFNVQMGAVCSDLPVTEIIRQAVESELTRSGHIIVMENEDLTIRGDILAYWVSTRPTLLYWDVIGEVSVIVEVKKTESDSLTKFGPFSGKNAERTYWNPSAAMMKCVLNASLDEVIQTMSSDEELASVFKRNEKATAKEKVTLFPFLGPLTCDAMTQALSLAVNFSPVLVPLTFKPDVPCFLYNYGTQPSGVGKKGI
jgi:uncharacterized lipoprotein YajG